MNPEDKAAISFALMGAAFIIAGLMALAILTPNPTTHCKSQRTLNNDACYLELTK